MEHRQHERQTGRFSVTAVTSGDALMDSPLIHRSLIWLERIYISMNPVKTTGGELRFSCLIGFRSDRTCSLVNPRALRSRTSDVFIVLQ